MDSIILATTPIVTAFSDPIVYTIIAKTVLLTGSILTLGNISGHQGIAMFAMIPGGLWIIGDGMKQLKTA